MGIFSNLLEKALKDWPKEVNFKKVEDDISLNQVSRYKTPENYLNYRVQGLYELADDIGAQHIGKTDEILMRNLHECIYDLLYRIAASLEKIDLASLQADVVKRSFEASLRDAMAKKSLGWRKKDIELVKNYFAENSKTT